MSDDQNGSPRHNVASGDRFAVLLVDDQRFIATVVERLLASERDIEFHHCGEAADALASAIRIRPAVILQDLVMPGMDGLTLVGLYRGNPSTAGTPIIVLSGDENDEVRERALAAGATDYLVKLPAKNALMACIRRHATWRAAEQPSGRDQSGAATKP
jgi:PleD family two-component response regulator